MIDPGQQGGNTMNASNFAIACVASSAIFVAVAASDATAQGVHGAATSASIAPITDGGYSYYGGCEGTIAGGTAGGSYNFGTGVGLGAFYSGLGDYRLKTGKGLEHRERARKQYIANTVLAVDAYYARRRVHASYAAETRTPPLSAAEARSIAAAKSSRSLGAAQFNPLTGEIAWPAALCEAEFDGLRERLESLFAAMGSQAGRGTTREIRQAAGELTEALKAATFGDETTSIAANDYLEAREFLRSLAAAAESNSPRPAAAAVAAN